MAKYWSAATGLALVAGSALAAPPAGERLAGGSLPGFVVGYDASNGQQSIVEQVPQGQTVERWTKMVTSQRFTGLAARSTPAAYADTILAQLPRSCPGAKASPVRTLQVSGRPAARFQVDCPRSAGGAPETFLFLAIAGQSNMYVKQVAFRGRVAASDLAWARGFLDAVVLCQARDRQPACQ